MGGYQSSLSPGSTIKASLAGFICSAESQPLTPCTLEEVSLSRTTQPSRHPVTGSWIVPLVQIENRICSAFRFTFLLLGWTMTQFIPSRFFIYSHWSSQQCSAFNFSAINHFTNGNLDKTVNHGQLSCLPQTKGTKPRVAHHNLIADKWGEKGLSA